MKPSIAKLQKFFKLESERDFDNKAVMGGLANILTSWEEEARVDGLPDSLIQAVITRLRDYHRLSKHSRKVSLQGLWNRIKRSLEEEDIENEYETGFVDLPEETNNDQIPSQTSPPPVPAVDDEEEEPPVDIEVSVTNIKGIGVKRAEALDRLGIQTIRDLLYHFPRRHDDYTKLKPVNRLQFGETVTIIGTVQQVKTRPVRSGKMKLVEAVVSDKSGALRVSWFNQPWIANKLQKNRQVVLSGKVEQYLGRLTMNNPEWEPLEKKNLHTNRIVPVYPLTEGVTPKWMRGTMHKAVKKYARHVQDPLPTRLREHAALYPLPIALSQIHFPDSDKDLAAAYHRLAFDEIFILQLSVLQQKHRWQNRNARFFHSSDEWIQEQLKRLPFELTAAQVKVLGDVRKDLLSGHPMNRLIQGDVGSGKTIIAALAILIITHSGAQTAMMAPTSILAEQHYQSLRSFLLGPGSELREEEIRLLIGSTPESEKSVIRENLQSGTVKVVVGTHALLEDPVQFADLQLAVIDEQHRFGVRQRAVLREKGENPHLMVMTATPIPRSLALTVYGDLDVSVIDELPPGRQPVETRLILPWERERVYDTIRREIKRGRQAFVITPLVEENDSNQEKAAVEEKKRLEENVFPEFKVGLMHGRLSGDEKEAAMTSFRDGEIDILVSTSVVEVGVDVPNATVMLIEGAHRFGLAQLHQFRGRVGRGHDQAVCYLVPGKDEQEENERLQAMVHTNDGFQLAEIDLEQRGPGQFLGTRQSGYSDLKLAKLTDVRLIEKARNYASEIYKLDPELENSEFQQLAEIVKKILEDREQTDIS